MGWKERYLDVILVPLSIMLFVCYHSWLWYKVRTQPFTTIIGINTCARRFWVSAMIKDNEKKNIIVIQTLRNFIMGSTLMATTSILLSTGLAAILSSTYSIKKPINDTVFGTRGEFMVSIKYVTLLTIFVFSFLCHSLSIRFFNQVSILINTPQDSALPVMPGYVLELFEKGFILNTVGNRLFYSALPLLFWIFGPILIFICSLTMVSLLYNLDFVDIYPHTKKSKVEANANTPNQIFDV